MKFPQKGQIQNILVKLKNFLIPQKIQEISMQSFYYTKYLAYRFKNWEHPKILKLVYLIFIVLSAVTIVLMSFAVAISLFLILFISPLRSGRDFSEEYKSMYDCYPYNVYGEESSFYCSNSDDD